MEGKELVPEKREAPNCRESRWRLIPNFHLTRYFIQPSSHHVTQVVNGLPAAKSPAFRYVQAKGAKVENANKIYYVKGVAHKGHFAKLSEWLVSK